MKSARRHLLLIPAAGILLAAGSVMPMSAQQSPLPKVAHAWTPLYPFFRPVQGTVALDVSTDGNRVLTIDAETGPYELVAAAKDNVRTWEFEPHTPTSFEVRFNYTLLPSGCKCKTCGTAQTESVVLHLPAEVDVNGVHICDPAVERSWRERPGFKLFQLPSAIGRGFVKLLSKLA